MPIQLPIGAEDKFIGMIDLVDMVAEIYKDELGKEIEITDIPADMQEQANEYREKMIESVVETDEDMMEKYFAGEELTRDEIVATIRKATIANEIVRCFVARPIATKASNCYWMP